MMNPLVASILIINVAVARGDHCESNCVNGVCIEQSNSVQCFCYNGYTGHDCSINFDECLPGRNRCQNNATCVNDIPEARCLCPVGFCGRYCEMEINECHSNPCLNGGACVDKLNGFECVCTSGYAGDRCEVDIDACDQSFLALLNQTKHCENGGTCKDGPGNDYFCVCPQGFTGSRCEHEINECDSHPCTNNGRCVKTSNTFKCICPYGWTGRLCEKPMKLCSTNPCHNRALCMELDDEFKFEFYCFCPPDFHGKLCENRFNECEPNNCQNGATCIDQVNGYHCSCLHPYVGSDCEVNCDIDFDNPQCLIQPTTPFETVFTESTPFEFPLSTFGITESSANPTVDGAIKPTATIEPISPSLEPTITPMIPPEVKETTEFDRVFAPNFNGHDSLVVFQTRRVKRMSNQYQMAIIAEAANGTILHAITNTKYYLLVYLENQLVVAEFGDQHRQVLRVKSSVPIELNKPSLIKISLSAMGNALYVELNIFDPESGQLIHSVSNRKPNQPMPCLERFQFGQSTSRGDAFRGCIYRIQLNDEEKFVQDSIGVRNVSECVADVCRLHPCANDAQCVSDGEHGWVCSCPEGYRSWLCQEAFCPPDYCHNGGLCLIQEKHICVCSQGYTGPRCESKLNLTFPQFNIGVNNSFIKYRLPYNLMEFFEIRFRFISHDPKQTEALLMFMGQVSTGTGSNSSTLDFLTLLYDREALVLRVNLGQGDKILRATTDKNLTEQMALFGRYRQVFWLLVIPAGKSTPLSPVIGRTPLHQHSLNVDPYLYVGGHEDWQTHPALYNLRGFQGCIYDIDIRISRQANFTPIDETLIDNMAEIEQCDFECT